jgi:thiamine biosynthesis lipoprotein
MHRVEHVMGMPIIVAGCEDDAAVDRVFDWFREVEERFSTYRPDSEISRLNRGELSLDGTHADVRWVLRRCEELREETDGFFDAGVDPTGLVKGWSVDRAAAILDEAGAGYFAINAGGDMVVRGGPWRVGIQHPEIRLAVAKTLELSDRALATSGEYARGAHILDPHTGRPPEGILSVTVLGSELGTADAYATAAFAMGAGRAPHWLARLRDHESILILADGRVLSTPGIDSYESLNEAAYAHSHE